MTLYDNELLIGTIFNKSFYQIVCKLTQLFYMLFRYQVRKLKGAFQRAYGIHAGAALVKVCGLKKLSHRILGCYVTSRDHTGNCVCEERVIKHPSWGPVWGVGGGRAGGGDKTGIGVAYEYSHHSSLSACVMGGGCICRRNKV